MKSMKRPPDWGQQAVIAAWVLGIPTLGIAVLSYAKPPDPAHPMSFDFLSKSLSMPPWLVVASALIIAFGSIGGTRWYLIRSLARNPLTPSRPNIPAILKVSVKLVRIEDSRRDQVTIILRNAGGSLALHVQFNDINLSKTCIRFFDDIPQLDPGTATKPIKPYVLEYPDSKKRDMALAMFDASYGVHGTRTNEAYDYQGGATFFDAQGTQYQANWIYTFYPFRFKHNQLDDPNLVADRIEEIGPYLTVSAVEISKKPSESGR
jgi:hypothetical protein